MRRVTGLILAVLGIILIAAAILLPTYVSGQIVKFPLNESTTATLAGTGVSYFSQTKLTSKTGVSVRATYTIKGDAAAGSSSTAVWNQTASVQDVTNNLPVSSQTRRFAFDRHTAVLVNCCGANVNGNHAIHQTGIVGYVFPMGTQKQTYQVFDTTLNRAVPFTYSGTADTHGITTYMFTENVPATQVTTVTVPGAFFGLKAKTVTLPEMYQIHLDLLGRPGDRGAAQRQREREGDPAEPGHRRHGRGAVRRRPGGHAGHRDRGGQPGLQRPHRAVLAQHDRPDGGRDRRRPGPDRRDRPARPQAAGTPRTLSAAAAAPPAPGDCSRRRPKPAGSPT